MGGNSHGLPIADNQREREINLCCCKCRGAKLATLNVSLACGFFQAENTHGAADWGRNFELPPNCLKEFRERVSGIALSPEISERIWARGGGGNSREGLEIRVHSVSHCLCRAQQLFTKHLLFHFHVNYFPPLWCPKPLPSASFCVFSWKWYLRWDLWLFWWVTQFSMVSPMNICY